MFKSIKIEGELKKKSGIYKIVINNKFYIGSACNLYHRIHTHKSSLLKNKHNNNHLQRSFNRHEYFTFEILAECPKEYLIKLEQWFIDTLKPEFNIRKQAQSNYGLKMSEECKKNHSISSSKWQKEVGFSEETKKKMSKVAKGRRPHINTINAAREAMKNKIYTDEMRELASENMKRIRAKSQNYNFKGERNNQSKLKDYQILEIRDKLKSGIKGVQLAIEYGVSKYCISLIKTNKSYTHVQ